MTDIGEEHHLHLFQLLLLGTFHSAYGCPALAQLQLVEVPHDDNCHQKIDEPGPCAEIEWRLDDDVKRRDVGQGLPLASTSLTSRW